MVKKTFWEKVKNADFLKTTINAIEKLKWDGKENILGKGEKC